MVPIATLGEFASFLQVEVNEATSNLLLLDLAQGLVTEQIGDHDPWPATAKAVVLAAAGRSYRNPEGSKRTTVGGTTDEWNAEEMGVYLTDSEVGRLRRWLSGPGGSTTDSPRGCFPAARAWPDPAEC